MDRVKTLRELDARAWKEGKADGIVPDLGAVAIVKFTCSAGASAGKSRRYYGLNGKKATAAALYRRARALDARDGLQVLLAKCCRESAVEELRAKREALHG